MWDPTRNCKSPDYLLQSVYIGGEGGRLQKRCFRGKRHCDVNGQSLSMFPKVSLKLVPCLVSQWCLTLCNPMDWGPPGSSAWDSPSKNTGVGCHALTQRIFLIQEFKPHLSCLLHQQVGSLPLEPPGKPSITWGTWKIIERSSIGVQSLLCEAGPVTWANTVFFGL